MNPLVAALRVATSLFGRSASISIMLHDKSHAAFDLAKQLMPGGVNSPARAFGGVGGEPIFFDRAKAPISSTSTATAISTTLARGGR